jgi:hypothetical protein
MEMTDMKNILEYTEDLLLVGLSPELAVNMTIKYFGLSEQLAADLKAFYGVTYAAQAYTH